jgi:signal transduction histidine kinase
VYELVLGLTSQLVVFLINVVGISLVITIWISKADISLKRIFVAMSVMMFVWVDFAYIARVTDNREASLIFIRTAWTATPLLCSLIVIFVSEYFQLSRKHINRYFVLITVFLAGVTATTGSIIADINYVSDNEGLEIIYGDFFFFYFIIISFLVLWVIRDMAYYTFSENATKGLQDGTLYVVVGLTLFFIANSIFNLLLPAVFGVVDLYWIGDYSTVVFMLLIGVATLRGQFIPGKIVVVSFVSSLLGTYLLVDALLLSTSAENSIVKLFVLFFFYIPFAVVLIKSVLRELKQKQIISNLAAEQKDIIDVMGHEVRTPLTVIGQELNLHKEITLPNSEDIIANSQHQDKLTNLFESISIMDQAHSQAVSVVNDMIETARIDKGKFSLNITSFDVISLVEQQVEVYQKMMARDEAKVTVSFSSQLQSLQIEADETRIREALDALLTNAIKYGKNPDKNKTEVEVAVASFQNTVWISVKDNGRGIEKGDISKLGKKFTRLDPKTKNFERPGGTGLGLFVVKGVMAKHNGELFIESAGIGRGAKFTLVFPIKQET